MFSAILFISLQGDIIIQRYFRDDIPHSAAEVFRQQLLTGKYTLPIVQIDGVTFLYTRHNDVYLVMATKLNANAMLAFEFMCTVINVFTPYFGTSFTEESLRDHFVIIYELLDEMMDNGYPQLTSLNTLKSAISLGQAKAVQGMNNQLTQATNINKVTSFITGAVDWREAGKYYYKKNEVFLDVLESVNVLMGSDGTLLRGDVSGKIIMKAYLSGMPECRVGFHELILNTKAASLENNASLPKQPTPKNPRTIAIDDVTFHRCVQLSQFDRDHTVSFIPPDGEFTLMKYRVASKVQMPFSIISSVITRGRSKVDYQIVIRSNFGINSSLAANDVKLIIPVPSNTASVKTSPTHGKAKLKPLLNAIQWKIPRIFGSMTYTLQAEAQLAATVDDKPWTKPPINVEFTIPMFTASGLKVKFLKLTEASNYEPARWVRYSTSNGTFEVRI